MSDDPLDKYRNRVASAERALDLARAELAGAEADPRCRAELGRRPEWMGVDQWDPCRCRLDAGHEPVEGGEDGHWCEHLDVPDPRLAAPVPGESPSAVVESVETPAPEATDG
jgi:hypothetical protein